MQIEYVVSVFVVLVLLTQNYQVIMSNPMSLWGCDDVLHCWAKIELIGRSWKHALTAASSVSTLF